MTSVKAAPRVQIGASDGRWLAAAGKGHDARPGQAYPCRCDEDDPNPPAWAKGALPVCRPWQLTKGPRTGQWSSKCPCWGQEIDPATPEACCRRHEGNPWYGPRWSPLTRAAGVVRDPDTGAEVAAEPAELIEPIDTPVVVGPDIVDLPDHDVDPRYVQPKPYVRRWTHDELHCGCPTPWDGIPTGGGKTGKTSNVGHHCTNCHQNFRNTQVAQLHQRWVTDRCKPAESIVDCDTGVPLLRPGVVAGLVVWG